MQKLLFFLILTISATLAKDVIYVRYDFIYNDRQNCLKAHKIIKKELFKMRDIEVIDTDALFKKYDIENPDSLMGKYDLDLKIECRYNFRVRSYLFLVLVSKPIDLNENILKIIYYDAYPTPSKNFHQTIDELLEDFKYNIVEHRKK